MKKSVYFAAAIRGDTLMASVVKKLIKHIRYELKIEVLSEHVGHDNPVEEFSPKI